jgi:hypothetical protein
LALHGFPLVAHVQIRQWPKFDPPLFRCSVKAVVKLPDNLISLNGILNSSRFIFPGGLLDHFFYTSNSETFASANHRFNSRSISSRFARQRTTPFHVLRLSTVPTTRFACGKRLLEILPRPQPQNASLWINNAKYDAAEDRATGRWRMWKDVASKRLHERVNDLIPGPALLARGLRLP